MVKIDQKPESPLSPIKFFVSKQRLDRAIDELGDGSFAQPLRLKTGLHTSWCIKVGHDGYLRESGEVF